MLTQVHSRSLPLRPTIEAQLLGPAQEHAHLRGRVRDHAVRGGVAERPKARVLKTREVQASGGPNPSSSANTTQTSTRLSSSVVELRPCNAATRVRSSPRAPQLCPVRAASACTSSFLLAEIAQPGQSSTLVAWTSWVRIPLSAPSPLAQHNASPTALWRNWQTRGIQDAVFYGREGSIPSGATTNIRRALHARRPHRPSGRGGLPLMEETRVQLSLGTNRDAPRTPTRRNIDLLPPSSRGPGRRPFKARTRVRISLGEPPRCTHLDHPCASGGMADAPA